MGDYEKFRLKDINDINKLESLGFEYVKLYDGYVYTMDTGVSKIRFIIFLDKERKGKFYIDSSVMWDMFKSDRIWALLKSIGIDDLMVEDKSE